MGKKRLEAVEAPRDGFLSFQGLGFSWNSQDDVYPTGGLFASVGQMGIGGFGLSPNSPNPRDNSVNSKSTDLLAKYVSPEFGYRAIGIPMETVVEAAGIVKEDNLKKEKKKGGVRVKIRIGNPSFRRLISGAFAGAVSRTAVAPLETIRTHLMVGSSGNSSMEVFQNIMKTDGWKGLFRGNFVNVIRVAPSKAIEVSD